MAMAEFHGGPWYPCLRLARPRELVLLPFQLTLQTILPFLKITLTTTLSIGCMKRSQIVAFKAKWCAEQFNSALKMLLHGDSPRHLSNFKSMDRQPSLERFRLRHAFMSVQNRTRCLKISSSNAAVVLEKHGVVSDKILDYVRITDQRSCALISDSDSWSSKFQYQSHRL